MAGLVGTNMTNFFNRELFMYSLGDIKFKKPISLKKMAFTMLFLCIWTFPLLFVFGLRANVYFVCITFLPPFFLADLCVKPIFGGKNLIEFVITMFKFFSEPKGWTDLRNNSPMGKEVFFTEQEIWVGRRREIEYLTQIREQKIAEHGERKVLKQQRKALKTT